MGEEVKGDNEDVNKEDVDKEDKGDKAGVAAPQQSFHYILGHDRLALVKASLMSLPTGTDKDTSQKCCRVP